MMGRKAARVVFVDDEPQVCAIVRKTLQRAGAAVHCFSNAQDCLRHLATAWCDLLITDVRMPGRDGIDLLAEVKERLPWIPVLIVTGYADVPVAVQALKAGAADFVEKPLDRDKFLRTVERLLEQNARPAAFVEESLTRAERRVLYHVLEGRNNREIAAAVHRSPRTIEVHRRHLMQKLGVANIIELLQRAADLGLIRAAPRDPSRWGTGSKSPRQDYAVGGLSQRPNSAGGDPAPPTGTTSGEDKARGWSEEAV